MTLTMQHPENVWKPTRFRTSSLSEEEAKVDNLNKTVLRTMNKLTPDNFDTLVGKVQQLQIDTQEELQGISELVYKKAVNEPQHSLTYASMCRELCNMKASEGDDSKNLKKLILTHCENEFGKEINKSAKESKLKEIENCTDSRKKKELKKAFDEEEMKIRKKSVGSIKFIGELFKQDMMTQYAIIDTIRHLLTQRDDESLECLCKLLSIIGNTLEQRGIDLADYFKQMEQIVNEVQLCPRMRFMLLDTIELRENGWVARRKENVPKAMAVIKREFEAEQLAKGNSRRK